MSRIRIYIEPELIQPQIRLAQRDNVHKLRDVLRLEKENQLYVFDGQGNEYLYRLDDLDRRQLIISQEKVSRRQARPDHALTLAFPLLNEEKTAYLLQKAVELGADVFVPFSCERSLKAKAADNKFSRWRRIIIEACRQSERLWLPRLLSPVAFSGILGFDAGLRMVATITGQPAQALLPQKPMDILIAVGPTGDFSHAEYEQFRQSGFSFLKLSKNMLRVETAAAFAVGVLNYFRL